MMAFAMINIRNNQVKFINAGMPSIFIYKKSEEKIIEYETQSMPLGALTNQNFTINNFEVSTGDVIMMLTDGLPELFNINNEYYSYERIKKELLDCADESPGEIIDTLKSSAAVWSSGVIPIDDVTMIVLKIK